jgi:hypothetical protein
LVFNTHVCACDEKTFSILAPSFSGKKIGVPVDTKVLVTEISPSGLTVVDTHVREVRPKPHVTWDLPIPEMERIHRIQNRREPRYELDLHLLWRDSETSLWKEGDLCHVVNINSMGALISVERELEVGDEITLDLTNLLKVGGERFDKKIQAVSTVVRLAGESGTVAGIRFGNLGRRERSAMLDALRRLKSSIV